MYDIHNTYAIFMHKYDYWFNNMLGRQFFPVIMHFSQQSLYTINLPAREITEPKLITFVEYHNKQQILPGLFPCVFSSTPSYETLHIICLMTVPHSDVERLCQDQKNHKPSNWSLSVNQEEKRYLIVPSTCTGIFFWLI